MNFLSKKSWNPYVVGILIGFLALFTFYTVDRPMGFARAFAQVTVMIEKVFIPGHVNSNQFIRQSDPSSVSSTGIEWQLMLLIGVFIGAVASSKSSGDFKKETLPPLWQKRFGPSKAKRLIISYISGIILFIGTWIAGGCTMSHGINGSMQLALSGWVFFMVVFATGIITAMTIYRRVK